MTGKKQSNNPWYECGKCGQRLLKVFTTKHNDLNCGTIFPVIENQSVVTPISKAPSNSRILKLPFIHSPISAGIIFLSDAVIQECGFKTFSWVSIRQITPSPEEPGDTQAESVDVMSPVALQIWSIPAETTNVNSTHAIVTNDAVITNEVSVMNHPYYIQQIRDKFLRKADSIMVEIVGASVVDSGEFCQKLSRWFRHRLVTEKNFFRIRYYCDLVSVRIAKIIGVQSPTDDERIIVSKLQDLSCADIAWDELEYFEVTSSTSFRINSTDERNLREYFVTLNDIGGLSSCVQELTSFVQYNFSNCDVGPKGIILYGQHGTGKTMLVEGFCNSRGLYAVIYREFPLPNELSNPSFRSHSTVYTLNEACRVASANQPAVIIIENIETLASTSSSSRYNKDRVSFSGNLRTLISSLKKSKVILIATSTNIDLISPQLRNSNNFGKEIELPVPSATQREEICECMLKKLNHDLGPVDIKAVAAVTHGFVGADLRTLFSHAATLAMKSLVRATKLSDFSSGSDCCKFSLSHVQKSLKSVRPSSMKSILIEVPNVKWTDIGGQKELKLKLKQAIEWPLKHPEAFCRLGITPPKGILMYGPPGCSKTMIARAIATESGLNFISVKGSDLFSKWVGESEKAVQKIFRKARQVAPSIVFFDEIDSLGGERGSSCGSSNVHERVLSQLLVEIDGVEPLKEVTIVAATNRPDIIDQALLRPGRLDRIIYVPLPDADAREEIFKIWFRKMPISQLINIKNLVRLTEGYSGAEVTAVCHEAALHSLEENIRSSEILESHFMAALNTVRPRISKEEIMFYQKYSENFRSQ